MEQDFFRENPIRDCRVPPEVNLFSRSEQNGEMSLPFRKLSSFQSLISRQQFTEIEFQIVSSISFGWFADFGETLSIILGSSEPA